jgi:hypothetical protein
MADRAQASWEDRLDTAIFWESGSNAVAGEGFEEDRDSQVAEEFGGPCRGRTYGPLIKSQLLYQLS